MGLSVSNENMDLMMADGRRKSPIRYHNTMTDVVTIQGTTQANDKRRQRIHSSVLMIETNLR